MAVSPQRGLAADQCRAVWLLAAAPNGATEAIMLAHDRQRHPGECPTLPTLCRP
jgi:hypothetical protein